MSPSMSRRLALSLLVATSLVPAVSGCGGEETQAAAPAGSVPSAIRDGEIATTIYFLVDGGAAPIGVRRAIAEKSPFAQGALAALLAGPSAAERSSGITSAIPAGSALRSFTFADNGTEATVDLSGLPTGADAVERVRVITQVARSLIGLSGIDRVRIRADGKPWGLWTFEGDVTDRAYGYAELAGWTGICVGAEENTEEDCFAALP
jgi:spore germination protein GerM